MRRRRTRSAVGRVAGSLGASVVASIAFVVIPTDASAVINNTTTWSANTLTGYCAGYTIANTRGGYVVAAQSFLRTYGSYTLSVDNYWGSGSGSALRSFQSAAGISADGCAGSVTWNAMFVRTVNEGSYSTPFGPCPDTARQLRDYQVSTRIANWYLSGYSSRGWKSDTGHGATYPVASPVVKGDPYVFDSPSLWNC